MKKLVVNADDFGHTKNINNGIIFSHVNGILTSASIMANGEAFDDAVKLSKMHPKLSIGLHVVLTGAKSVLAPAKIASITGQNGNLIENYQSFIRKFFSGGIKLIDIKREVKAQIEKTIDSGIVISHIDSHQHLHVLPSILDIVLNLADEYQIKWIRNSHDVMSKRNNLSQLGLKILGNIAKRRIIRKKLRTSDYFTGTEYTGQLAEKNMLYLLEYIPHGVSEIMCHPGDFDEKLNKRYKNSWGCQWEAERDALTSERIKHFIEMNNIFLTNYRDLQ